MHSQSDCESFETESSLPTHPWLAFPSSPPTIKPSKVTFDKPQVMASQPHFKSEPPATQNEEPSKPSLRRVSSEETERPPSAQQIQREDDASEEDEEELAEEELDPATQIVDFDWDALHHKYHAAMDTCHVEEGQLAEEWESLMNVHMRCSASRLRC
jgi:hypothetical protein